LIDWFFKGGYEKDKDRKYFQTIKPIKSPDSKSQKRATASFPPEAALLQ
jgi:N-acetylneuraminic acid mutarotase